MLSRIIKLTTRVWIAAITFAIGVALTMAWVVPRVRIETTLDYRSALSRPRQDEKVFPDETILPSSPALVCG